MIKKIWTERFGIRTSEMNAHGKLKIQALLNFFQESAIKHANHMGLGYNDVIKNNFAWVLSNLYIQIDTTTENAENLEVKTWPCGVSRFFALRDFDILADVSRKIAAGTSRWLAIDIRKRRLVREHDYFDIVHEFSIENKNRHEFVKFPGPVRWNTENTFKVRYSDMDINQHVNNINYVEWIIETIPHDILLEKDISSLEIYFLSEALYGNTILSRSTEMESDKNSFLHSIINDTNGKELVRAKTVWS